MRNDAVANDKVGSVQATDGDGTAPGNLVRYQIGQLSFCYKNSYSIASRRELGIVNDMFLSNLDYLGKHRHGVYSEALSFHENSKSD